MNAPDHRLAYDRDGTVMVTYTAGSVVTTRTQAETALVNADDNTGFTLPTGTVGLGLIFPIPMDLTAMFIAISNSSNPVTVQVSPDSTNGIDGTWYGVSLAGLARVRNTLPNYRDASQIDYPAGAATLGVRAVRLTWPSSVYGYVLYSWHLYASPSASATKDRLAIWHPTLDERVSPTYFDWGNVPRSTSQDLSFRIKNLSTDLTANTISVYTEALSPGTPSVAGMHTISQTGGSSFLPSISIPSLAPGAISPVYILRRVVPTNAQLSVWSARLAADVTSWT